MRLGRLPVCCENDLCDQIIRSGGSASSSILPWPDSAVFLMCYHGVIRCCKKVVSRRIRPLRGLLGRPGPRASSDQGRLTVSGVAGGRRPFPAASCAAAALHLVGRAAPAGRTRSSGLQAAQSLLPATTPVPFGHLPPGDPSFSQPLLGPGDPAPRPGLGLGVASPPGGGDLPAGRHQMVHQAFTRPVGQVRVAGPPPPPPDEEVAAVVGAFGFRHALGLPTATPRPASGARAGGRGGEGGSADPPRRTPAPEGRPFRPRCAGRGRARTAPRGPPTANAGRNRGPPPRGPAPVRRTSPSNRR